MGNGRWFPGFRTGTGEQVAAYREAEAERYRNERYEGAARIREETDRSDRLNGRVADTERPLSGTQRWWHRQCAATEVDCEFTRLQRASNRQDRGCAADREEPMSDDKGRIRQAWRDARAEDNQRHVRETLTARDPEFARTVDRAAREVSPRAQRRSR